MNHRLKILHIITSWESGTSKELAEFAACLPREDFDVKICVLKEMLGLRWTCDASAYLALARMIRQFQPDIVHTWDATAHAYGTLHFGKQRVIAEKRAATHNRFPFFAKLQHEMDKRTEKFIVPRANVMAESSDCPKTVAIPPLAGGRQQAADGKRQQTQTVLQNYLLPTSTADSSPTGDYYPVFEPQYDPVRRSYKPIPTHTTPFLIGITLPLCAEHRILDALWVFETLNHVHLNFHAFFIGDGKDRDCFLRYRDRWKLFSRVHFLGNSSEANSLLPDFDVLLHLSPSLEYSGAILSAMSCGVPVIALETSASRDYIQDGKTGFLVPSGARGKEHSPSGARGKEHSPHEGDFRYYRRTASKRLLYLLENAELRRAMQQAAKERLASEFNFDLAVQRRIAVYRELF